MVGEVPASDRMVDLDTPAPVGHDPVNPDGRFHDLDALRGFAMLLGIALHASLSFFPGFWVVVDSTATDDRWFDEFFDAVHGFRMPLFFALSGFFTAMLWRRRGIPGLLRHRIRRIAVPFAILVVPMGLAMTWTVERAIDAGVADYVDDSADIWAAVYVGNEGAVEALLDRGIDVDAPNASEGGNTPLHVAALTGDVAMVDLLIDRGADPEAVAEGGRPVDYAVYFGNAETADVLVAAGAEDPRPPGTGWQELGHWGGGVELAEQLSRDLGLDPWVGAGWAKQLNHLWFLWFLLWLVAGFAVVAFVVERVSGARCRPGRWSGVLVWVMIPLAVAPQLAMGDGGAIRVFGPDTSTRWVPVWHVLAYYAVFFAFGALVSGRRNRRGGPLGQGIGRWWPILLGAAAGAFVLARTLTYDVGGSWLGASVAQVTYTWLAIFASTSLFRAALSEERRGVRYLSDSAYFLYLAHLPLIVLAQSWIRNWDLPATAKFAGLTVGITVLLLVVYQWCVRYTPIGTLLNGRRVRPARSGD